jgi:hypothetical protein
MADPNSAPDSLTPKNSRAPVLVLVDELVTDAELVNAIVLDAEVTCPSAVLVAAGALEEVLRVASAELADATLDTGVVATSVVLVLAGVDNVTTVTTLLADV